MRDAAPATLQVWSVGHIGSIDLRCLRKLNPGDPDFTGSDGRLLRFELVRRAVLERRVEPANIVVTVNELFQVSSQAFEILVLDGVNLLLLERFHKTLNGGIIIGTAGSAHARQHPGRQYSLHVLAARILHPAVGMMHYPRRWLSIGDRSLSR